MILASEILTTITVTVVGLLVILLLLVIILLYVKQKLTPTGPVKITINKEKVVEVPIGGSLLSTLGNEKIFLPSACGGAPCSPVGGKHSQPRHRTSPRRNSKKGCAWRAK